MSVRLPSRYEDLDEAFRGRLKPNQPLLALVKQAFHSMSISGGIRFLPVFGESGSGKTSAALEIGTHLPDILVEKLSRSAVEDSVVLRKEIEALIRKAKKRLLVVVIDQYEEVAAQRALIPTSFVETISLLDRSELRNEKILFVWLTTSLDFQKSLSDATSRNRRILVSSEFSIVGLSNAEWPEVIKETFEFHNHDRPLSDYEVLDVDLAEISESQKTLGDAIEFVGKKLAIYDRSLHDLSTFQVVMLWPVTDGLRIQRIQQFTDARQGYKLDWNAWYRQINSDDQKQLPLREFNRARLYFDMRLVPVAAADLHPLCKHLDDDNFDLKRTYLDRLKSTHFFSIVSGAWNPDSYSPLRERASARANEARDWYETVTTDPTRLGRRLAKCLRALDVDAEYEQTIDSPYSKVRADVLVQRKSTTPPKVIVELKAYSAENTMPSSICQAIQTTLRRHAQFAGFLKRQ